MYSVWYGWLLPVILSLCIVHLCINSLQSQFVFSWFCRYIACVDVIIFAQFLFVYWFIQRRLVLCSPTYCGPILSLGELIGFPAGRTSGLKSWVSHWVRLWGCCKPASSHTVRGESRESTSNQPWGGPLKIQNRWVFSLVPLYPGWPG